MKWDRRSPKFARQALAFYLSYLFSQNSIRLYKYYTTTVLLFQPFFVKKIKLWKISPTVTNFCNKIFAVLTNSVDFFEHLCYNWNNTPKSTFFSVFICSILETVTNCRWICRRFLSDFPIFCKACNFYRQSIVLFM